VIAVCLPSRALVHSRTMQDILANALGEDELGFYFSHGNPIPDCQNIIVEEALLDKPDYIWMVEDDQQLPSDILKELLEANADIAVADYPVRGNKHSITYIRGSFAYAGLGCVLIKPHVFDRLERPYFRVDTEYVLSEEGLTPTKAVMGNHGLSDVDFWQRCIELDLDIKVIDTLAGHYYLKKPELPKFGNNTALEYEVETWTFT
jgi:hypothetical protein